MVDTLEEAAPERAVHRHRGADDFIKLVDLSGRPCLASSCLNEVQDSIRGDLRAKEPAGDLTVVGSDRAAGRIRLRN
jgi:hypothetical protein